LCDYSGNESNAFDPFKELGRMNRERTLLICEPGSTRLNRFVAANHVLHTIADPSKVITCVIIEPCETYSPPPSLPLSSLPRFS
jgi:hypothetical protein